MTVVGARPQFIKAAVVSRAIVKNQILDECLVHTGQHHDTNMSEIFFDALNIPLPKYNLGIAGGGHGAMTGRMLEQLEEVMVKEAPDMLLVYGDTNSTLAGALAAAKLHIPVAHVEAGLRSFNRAMPEEVNRVLTDHCSDILFTPTDMANDNLMNEGIPSKQVIQVGDVMYDCAVNFSGIAEEKSTIISENKLEKGIYILATVHRAENTDNPERLKAIFTALQSLSMEMQIILPLHPRTQGKLKEHGLESLTRGLILLPPIGYLDMVALERSAALIVTDSGGVQKEAFFHGVPCATLRDETEWPELLESGWNRLIPPNGKTDIKQSILDAIGTTGQKISPYGNADSSDKVAESIATWFK